MDLSKWCNLKSEPSLKNLTEAGFGVPKDKQHVPVQELVKAHIESFDQAVTDGLCRVVEVRGRHACLFSIGTYMHVLAIQVKICLCLGHSSFGVLVQGKQSQPVFCGGHHSYASGS